MGILIILQWGEQYFWAKVYNVSDIAMTPSHRGNCDLRKEFLFLMVSFVSFPYPKGSSHNSFTYFAFLLCAIFIIELTRLTSLQKPKTISSFFRFLIR